MMGQLGYNTRGPLVDKLKNLLNDVQSSYEAFLDAYTLYQEGKIGERDYFIKMGNFLMQFSSLAFLMVKVIIELDNAISKGTEAKQVEVVKPMPQVSVNVKHAESKVCEHCGSTIPAKAKFCPKCGKQQS
jgi:ribosomal protein L40E